MAFNLHNREEIEELSEKTSKLSWVDISGLLKTNKAKAQEVMELTLIGRLVSRKTFTPQLMHPLIRSGWGFVRDLKIEDAGQNRFLFTFPSTEDKEKVLQQGPWNFKGFLMVLKDWSSSATLDEIELSKGQFWIQIHGLPLERIETDNAVLIGSKLGKVVDFDRGEEHIAFLRVKVELNVGLPLEPGFYLPREDSEDLWISFKYERLSNLCTICGRLDHSTGSCEQSEPHSLQWALGEKMKAFTAKSISSEYGNTTSSVFGSSWQPSKSPIFGLAFNSTSASAGSSSIASAGSVGATITSPTTGFSLQASTASMPYTSSSTGFPFTASTPVAVTSSAPAVFGSTIGVSSGPNFGFTSAMATPSSQPVFGNTNPGFLFNSASSVNNDQMNMEDSKEEDTVQASAPTVPVFVQPSVSPAQSGFAFGSIAPSAASPFSYGALQNSAQNSSPFQDTNILGGSFSVGRRVFRVSRKPRKK